MPDKPLCAVPFVEAFTADGRGGYRNCCSTDPAIQSQPNQTFDQWWTGQPMQQFRTQFRAQRLPAECYKCEIEEKTSGHSMRLAVNAAHPLTDTSVTWPARWNVIFGNLCNLSCWTCNESFSSVIEAHKKKIKILPAEFASPQQQFDQAWPQLQQNILKSYQYHDTVTVTLLGGEPFFNPTVLQFLQTLMDLGLGHRTNLEFHTNGTNFNQRIQQLIDKQNWNRIFMFVSLDAVGQKAEWLRYGCKWEKIEQNICEFKQAAEYVEVHCILSMLNVLDLNDLRTFCNQQQIRLQVSLLSDPWFMNLQHWDQDPTVFQTKLQLHNQADISYYSQLIGKTPRRGAREALIGYIQQFDGIREPLINFDPTLAEIIMHN